jgi:Holliday junction DNA helicase RuvA
VYEYHDGRLAQQGPTRVVIEVGGVGYDVAVPVGARFPIEGGEKRTRVWTHLVVREDAQLLFGFPDPSLRELFRLLLKVRGVGPTLALAILSGLAPEELCSAIASGDAKRLRRVKGVGEKTARQILLDLADKVQHIAGSTSADVLVPRAGAASRTFEEAVQALVSIGYSEKEAHSSVERAAARVDPADLEALVRTALHD